MGADSKTSGKLVAKSKAAASGASERELAARQVTKKSEVVYGDFTYANSTPLGARKDVSGPMPAEYIPAVVESDWYSWWEKQGYFHADANSTKPPYVIPVPPPNVTGTLHIGHALVCALEDMLARVHRMRGFEVLWQPGSDHAGIATQVVVEKQLQHDLGKTRHEIGREAFLERVWTWVGAKSGAIFQQLRELGASLDWERSRFTMDDHMCKAVTEAFLQLFHAGKIYRENRLVNWDCSLCTAVSDIEVDFVEFAKPETYRVPLPRSRPDCMPNGFPMVDGAPITHKAYEFGWMTHFRYPIEPREGETQEEAGFIEIATTRLETMLTDQAVFIHPDDESKAAYRGRFVRHPFTQALIPIMEDAQLVKLGLGTGAVKITPGHDPHDFDAGKRHGLAFTSMLDDDGCIAAGLPYAGMFRYEARLAMERDLAALGLFVGKVPHAMAIGVSQRSGDIIEPRCKPQWYLNSREETARALAAAFPGEDGSAPELEIVPASKLATWKSFLGDYRDWCISRQLWWGHRIPAYLFWLKNGTRPAGDRSEHYVCAATEEEAVAIALERLGASSRDEIELERDPDVLDTWFSSGLFPFSTVGWPDFDLGEAHWEKFFPASVLETGGDILFFWVARMVIMSYALTGKLCFKRVLLHTMVRDAHGKKMSKSLGNVIDPLHVIHGVTLDDLNAELDANTNLAERERTRAKKCQSADFPAGIPACGADALRFALCAYTGGAATRDINLDINRVVAYRALGNKIWNACRYAYIFAELRRPELGAADASAPAASLPAFVPVPEAELRGTTAAEKWILSRLHALTEVVNSAIDRFDVQAACTALQAWFIDDFCGWALEVSKPAIVAAKAGDAEAAAAAASARQVLACCLDNALRLFHPFMPFVTEELWQQIPHGYDAPETISLAPYPCPESTKQWADPAAEYVYSAVQQVVDATRAARAKYNLPNSQKSDVYLVFTADSLAAGYETILSEAGVAEAANALAALAAAASTTAVLEADRPAATFTVPLSGALAGRLAVSISLQGVDFAAEVAALRKREDNLAKYVATMQKKLDPAGKFMQSAPPAVVEKEQAKLDTSAAELATVRTLIEDFQKMM